MAKQIAIFNDTLDDIEVNGFMVMSDKEVEAYEELASSITWEFSYPIGESVLEYTSGDDLLTRIDFKPISSEEFKALKRIFNLSFGVFVTDTFLESIVSDDDDDEIDDEIDDFDNYDTDDY